MALQTFTDLKTSIGRWLHRGDLASVAPDLITLAEARIYQGSADSQMPTDPLRLSSMEAVATGTVSGDTIPMPDGLIEIRKIQVGDDGPEARVLDYADRDRITDLRRYPGCPKAYTLDTQDITLGPAPDGEYPYRLVYFQRFPALSADNATNWLLTNAPNVYLYGSLIEAAPYLNNDARLTTWYRLFAAALQAVQSQDNRLRFGGGALVMRPR